MFGIVDLEFSRIIDFDFCKVRFRDRIRFYMEFTFSGILGLGLRL